MFFIKIPVKLKYIPEEYSRIGYHDRLECTSYDNIHDTIFTIKRQKRSRDFKRVKDALNLKVGKHTGLLNSLFSETDEIVAYKHKLEN